MKKRIICAALVTAMIFSFYGCGTAATTPESIEGDAAVNGGDYAGEMTAEAGTGGAAEGYSKDGIEKYSVDGDAEPKGEAGITADAGSTTTTTATAGADTKADVGTTAAAGAATEGTAADTGAATKAAAGATTTTTATAAVGEAYDPSTESPEDSETTSDSEVISEPVSDTDSESPERDLPEAGQLTAGEWNDNDNWGFFANLVNSGTISFPSFGIDPTNRTSVTVKAKDGSVLTNAAVRLLDKDGKVLWSAVTDKQGTAYLFGQKGAQGVSIEVESKGAKQSFEVVSGSSGNGQTGGSSDGEIKASDNAVEVTFDGSGELYKATDIMFLLDTTGSMSDEMLFLQSEFSAITKELGTKDTRYSVNFYRDEGDDYVTKCSDFTSEVKDIQKALNNETADGGGDYPEAVAEALTESISKTNWKEDSVKLCFMIFDAPPHDGKEAELLSVVEDAAAKGIRIIPVVASDSNRSTELFGRALAITTGGSYVFLTDDSGIGNSHAEPVIGSYEVKPLYDIIIDVVNRYKQ